MKEILEKLEKIKDKIFLEKRNLRFFGLIARIDIEEKWDLLISADWIEKSSSETDLVYIIGKLKEEFGEKLDFLSRIVLLTPDESFIRQLARAIVDENENKEKEITKTQEKKDLRTDVGFVIKHIFVVAFAFKDIDLDTSQEMKEGPIAMKDTADF